jgi:hypothetical protein
MDNVSFVEIETINSKETMALIDRGNGEFTSMTKATYDEMIAQQTGGN